MKTDNTPIPQVTLIGRRSVNDIPLDVTRQRWLEELQRLTESLRAADGRIRSGRAFDRELDEEIAALAARCSRG